MNFNRAFEKDELFMFCNMDETRPLFGWRFWNVYVYVHVFEMFMFTFVDVVIQSSTFQRKKRENGDKIGKIKRR